MQINVWFGLVLLTCIHWYQVSVCNRCRQWTRRGGPYHE